MKSIFRPYQLGAMAVVALVVLRLSLGCHFLYEGVWKIEHRDEFSAEPFLTQAKGPAAGLFYAMLPDIDGRQRLQAEVQFETTKGGVVLGKSERLAQRWDALRQQFVDFYRPSSGADEAEQKSFERLQKAAEKTLSEHKRAVEEYLGQSREEIEAYFAALDRFQDDPEGQQQAKFQKQRRWEQMQKLRSEAGGWLKEIDAREESFKSALRGLLDEQQRAKGAVPASWNPLSWNRVQQINFAVTFGLAAIGLCLMLGLFTRLAALGGAAFMCFVVLTQPAWPAIYPPDPAVVGHALLINKDFVEMVALLTIAATAVGRWGGLDYFLHYLIVEPFWSRRMGRKGRA